MFPSYLMYLDSESSKEAGQSAFFQQFSLAPMAKPSRRGALRKYGLVAR